ncbi:ABC transporter ATP-binding protein [Candidatus Acetothermia bacterium]|nr:ABC transporter ATP-binding protein [Candidatus Acetothermia bacterium]MBI3642962.1 ABC transporter ATP-binding protein [Candidatus Acetothermia bacterium]
MPLVVQAKNLTKIYRMGSVDVHALDGVDVTIEEGASLAIMGPSGSGKSTLMNLIGCLDRPTSGTLILAGKDISKLKDKQLAKMRGEMIGFVFQTFNLIPRVSALANVMLPMSFVKTIPKRKRKTRAMEILERVGLGQRVKHMPSELSGGERQRVAVARALINDPKLIFADEPTGNLDSKTGKSILELFKGLNDEGRTIITVTHDSSVASYSERMIYMVDGKIEKQVAEVATRGAA